MTPFRHAETTAMRAAGLRRLLGMAIVFGAALSGCGGADTGSQLAKAQQRLNEGDATGAEIEVRNVLKNQPELAAARLVLARTLMAAGNLPAAETELRRADEFGASPESTATARAELLLAQGRSAALVEQFATLNVADAATRADILTLVARAQRDLARPAEAEAAVAEALKLVPTHEPARLLQGRLLAARGDFKAALQVADDLIRDRPDRGGAWTLKADLLSQPGSADTQAAITAYRKALELQPRQVDAHSGLITLLLREGDVAGANTQVLAMRKAVPSDPTGRYYESLMAHLRGDFARARELLQPLLRGGASDPQLLFLAGVTELRLGGLEQAELALGRAHQARPDAPEPRVELARLHVQAGRSDKARALLAPLLQANTASADAWLLAAQAHALEGDFAAADAAFGRASQLKPDDPRIRTERGRSLVFRGQLDPGLRELQLAATSDRTGLAADLQLVSVHMLKNDTAAALKATDAMAAKQPQQALPDHVRGRILQAAADLPGARAAYEKAVAKDPRFLPAVSSLAQLDLADNQLEAARKRYEALVKLDPRAAPAWMALAVITRREGGSRDKAAALVDQAVKVNPLDAAAWRAAVAYHRQDRDTAAALSRARSATAALPDDAELLADLARAQLAAGEMQQAQASLARLQARRPTSAEVALLMAEAHLAAGDTQRARSLVTKALTLDGSSVPALRAAIGLAVQDQQPQQALALAREVQKRLPQQALGWQLEAEAETLLRRWPAAAAAARKAYEREASTAQAIQLHDLLLRQGDEAAAGRLEREWTTRHPRDLGFVLHQAQTAAAAGRLPAAIGHYRQALEIQPGNAPVMNNLAHVLVLNNDPAALGVATEAFKLAPQAPEVLDTLASALGKARQWDKAIAAQTRAVELLPQDGSYRFRLAQIYRQADKPEQARDELQRLADAGLKFPEQAEAQKALRELTR